MTILRWNSRVGMDELRRDLDRLLQLSRVEDEAPVARPGVAPVWTPAVDVSETAEAFVIDVELPGVQQADIQLHLDRNSLILKGERRHVLPQGGETLRVERTYGEFQRVFNLPVNVVGDHVRATLKDGILHLHLPKVEIARPKQIPVIVAQ